MPVPPPALALGGFYIANMPLTVPQTPATLLLGLQPSRFPAFALLLLGLPQGSEQSDRTLFPSFSCFSCMKVDNEKRSIAQCYPSCSGAF